MVHPGPYLGPFPWCTRVPCTQRSQGSAESWGLPVLAAGTPDGHFRCAMAVTAMSGTLVFGAGAGHRFQILTLRCVPRRLGFTGVGRPSRSPYWGGQAAIRNCISCCCEAIMPALLWADW